MVLGKLPVPGRPTDLDWSRARAYCTCCRCWCGLFGIFSLVYHFPFLSPSLWEMALYRLKYCLEGPKQPTNELYFLMLCVNSTLDRSGMKTTNRTPYQNPYQKCFREVGNQIKDSKME